MIWSILTRLKTRIKGEIIISDFIIISNYMLNGERIFVLSILNTISGKIKKKEFVINNSNYKLMLSHMQFHKAYPSDIQEVVDFLRKNIKKSQTRIQTLIEFEFQDAIPKIVLLNEYYSLVKILLVLSKEGYGDSVFSFGENDERKATLHLMSCNGIKFFPINILSNFKTEYSFVPDEINHFSVLIDLFKKNLGLFYFFMTEGLVHSSEDIRLFILHKMKRSLVVSSEEVFALASTDEMKTENIDKIALEYAIASKMNEFLPNQHRIKIALLSVCRAWEIAFMISSFRNKNMRKSYLVFFDNDLVLNNIE